MADVPPESEPEPELVFELPQLAGVWANTFRVSERLDEFVIDFIRLDPFVPEAAFVVARVAMAPHVAATLRDVLDDAWKRYAQRSLPKEVYGGLDEGSDEDPRP